jgi:hypothetical protein
MVATVLFTLNLTINNLVTGTDIQSACNSFTWIDGNTYTTSTNTPTYTYIGGSANGCDSIVTLNLTINNVDVTINQNIAELTANNINATYSWLDCNNNFSSLLGETNQTFNPLLNGSYAVEVTENGCKDTSICVEYTLCDITASFSYINNGNGNYTFTNLSSGNHNQYNWDFGDGISSQSLNVSHTFLANGSYTVVLGVKDTTFLPLNTCQDFYFVTINVTSVPSPLICNAGFTIYPDTIPNNFIVFNSSSGNNLTYFWEFGDGKYFNFRNSIT